MLSQGDAGEIGTQTHKGTRGAQGKQVAPGGAGSKVREIQEEERTAPGVPGEQFHVGHLRVRKGPFVSLWGKQALCRVSQSKHLGEVMWAKPRPMWDSLRLLGEGMAQGGYPVGKHPWEWAVRSPRVSAGGGTGSQAGLRAVTARRRPTPWLGSIAH